MGNKKDIIPIVTASVIALVVTGVVKLLLPGGTVIKRQPLKKELSLPDIPLMEKKEKKKVLRVQVLITNAEIKKDQKITESNLIWKKWPADALQAYFIARDKEGNPLNNGADYSNALKMWAKNDIPQGIPLVMDMLTDKDPAIIAEKKKKEQEEKAKKEQEEKKKKKKKEQEESNIIKPGYRAITLPIDQKATISGSMIIPGQLIDVIIDENIGQKIRTHTYRALKIIAVDGKTKEDYLKEENSSGAFGNLSVSKFFNPKSITLEVKANMVNIMLKQVGSNGVVLSLRNQNEKVSNYGEDSSYDEEMSMKNSLINEIIDMNRMTSKEILLDSKRKKEREEKNLSMLIKNMNDVGSRGGSTWFDNNKSEGALPVNEKTNESAGKYEISAGRIVGNVEKQKEEKNKIEVVRIYRKLTPDKIEFDKNGKKLLNETSSSTGGNMGGAFMR